MQYSLLHWNAAYSSGSHSTEKVQSCLSESSKGPQRWLRGWSISHEERLRELGLFILEQRRLRVVLAMCIDTWWGEWRRRQPFLVVPS